MRLKRLSTKTFKFSPVLKDPYVLRPAHLSLPVRLVLASMKAIGALPRQFFRSRLRLDCNERIVEIPFVLRTIPAEPGMKILAFGCVESVLPMYLAAQGAHVVGVDLRQYEFEHPNFRFQKGDFLANTFEGMSFDSIIAVSAVEHCGLEVYGGDRQLAGDRRAINEFLRLLKPGGLLALTVPFGKRYADSELRIYDADGLRELVEGFAVLERHFYMKAADNKYWENVSESDCASAGYDQITGVQGVALLSCRKPTSEA